MSHRMRSTSLEAYHEIQPTLGKRQMKVLDALRHMNSHGDYPTDLELTRFMGYYDPNKVRPRRHELVESDLVEEYEKRRCKVSKKWVWTWRATK